LIRQGSEPSQHIRPDRTAPIPPRRRVGLRLRSPVKPTPLSETLRISCSPSRRGAMCTCPLLAPVNAYLNTFVTSLLTMTPPASAFSGGSSIFGASVETRMYCGSTASRSEPHRAGSHLGVSQIIVTPGDTGTEQLEKERGMLPDVILGMSRVGTQRPDLTLH
jgi:hypothetical protein